MGHWRSVQDDMGHRGPGQAQPNEQSGEPMAGCRRSTAHMANRSCACATLTCPGLAGIGTGTFGMSAVEVWLAMGPKSRHRRALGWHQAGAR